MADPWKAATADPWTGKANLFYLRAITRDFALIQYEDNTWTVSFVTGDGQRDLHALAKNMPDGDDIKIRALDLVIAFIQADVDRLVQARNAMAQVAEGAASVWERL